MPRSDSISGPPADQVHKSAIGFSDYADWLAERQSLRSSQKAADASHWSKVALESQTGQEAATEPLAAPDRHNLDGHRTRVVTGPEGPTLAARGKAPPLSLIQYKQSETTDLQARIERYAKAKVASRLIAQHAPDIERGRRQIGCGDYLNFRTVAAGEQAGLSRLHAADFCCQPRTCPFCAVRYSAKNVQAYHPKLVEIADQNGYRFWFATFTVANGPCLAERFRHLMASYQKLVWRIKQGQQRNQELGKIKGGIAHAEVKRGSGSGEWHPHIHAVFCLSDHLHYKAVHAAWKAVSGGCNCYLRPLHSDKARGKPDYREALAKDLCEVLKYPMKFNEIAPRDIWQAAVVLRGKRFLRTFGCIRGLKIRADLLDEPLDWESLAYIDRVYRYACERGEFDLKSEVLHGATPTETSTDWTP